MGLGVSEIFVESLVVKLAFVAPNDSLCDSIVWPFFNYCSI